MARKPPKRPQNQQPGERLTKHADGASNDQIRQRLEALGATEGWSSAEPPTPSGAEVQAMGPVPTKSEISESE